SRDQHDHRSVSGASPLAEGPRRAGRSAVARTPHGGGRRSRREVTNSRLLSLHCEVAPPMETEDAKAAAPKPRAKLRTSVIVTIAALGVVAAAYYVFYRKQVDYYTGRNLRVISTLTAQIGGRVAMYTRHYRDGIVGDQQGPPAAGPIKRGLRE